MSLTPEVFISYSTKDVVAAEAVRAALEAQNIGCWIAPRDIPPGTDWSAAIIDALEECRVFLLILSTNSNDSEQVKREVQNAVGQRLPILPLRIEDVALSKQMRYFLGTPHWLDALTPPLEAHLGKLIGAVRGLLAPAAPRGENAATTPAAPSPLEEESSGVLTLVFTDIEGSSNLWEAHGDAFAPVLNTHNRLLREAARQNNGVEVKTEGDAFFLNFADAASGVRFAVDAQRALAACDWNAVLPGLAELRVRIGMHSGQPIVARHPDGTLDYFGPVVNRAARVGAAGYGGQVILSNATRELALVHLPPEITFEFLGHHRLKGVGEETLWQVLHPALPARFPPLKTLNGARHNLPPVATPLVGRERETTDWLGWLREPATRLVTLRAFGGHGKTRLALHLAELLVEEFADGVWWIELEEARDAEMMLARIAHELRLHLAPQPSLREQVLEYLRERELLLVLDNLEQIPKAGRVVGELLQSAPRVKCLATSRTALEIRQERIAEVTPLPATEAAQLFAERARSRVPEFEINADNASAIEELCRRLEGVPLAIELAASRIGVLSPQEMLARLGERFRLLQTRAPDLPPRQRALRGAIDWSHDLLGEEDRALFAQLAIFAGGFTIEAVEAICEEFDALEGLAELRRHSLLRAEELRGKTRFAMLESVRDYAADKLGALPERDNLPRRHAAYFLQFARLVGEALHTRREAEALGDFSGELANLRAALGALQSDAEGAANLALAMHEPLHRLGFWDEARQVLQTGLAALGDGAAPLRAGLQLGLASVALDTGDGAAEELASAALREFRAQGDRAGEADALNLLGLIASARGDAAAQPHFENALALRPAHDHHGRAIALHNLALQAANRGDAAEASRLYEAALVERRAGGDARGEATTLGNLGALAFDSGDRDQAKTLYLQSLELRRALRDQFGIALMLFNLAEVAEHTADWPRAAALYVHAQRLFHDLGSPYESAPREALARLQTQRDDCAALQSAAEVAAWEDWV